jgi:hypothetical protein
MYICIDIYARVLNAFFMYVYISSWGACLCIYNSLSITCNDYHVRV